MKTRIAMCLLMITMALSMIVVNTAAYFSDTGKVSHNTFTAGEIDLKFSNGGGTYRDSLSGAWSSPKGWAPGGECSSKLSFTNTGSVDARYLYFSFTATGSGKLMDVVVVTTVVEYFNGKPTHNLAPTMAASVGDGDGVLTLHELVSTKWVTQDDMSGDHLVLAGGNRKDYRIAFAFRFPDVADDSLQGLHASFDLKCVATQQSSTGGFHSFHK